MLIARSVPSLDIFCDRQRPQCGCCESLAILLVQRGNEYEQVCNVGSYAQVIKLRSDGEMVHHQTPKSCAGDLV